MGIVLQTIVSSRCKRQRHEGPSELQEQGPEEAEVISLLSQETCEPEALETFPAANEVAVAPSQPSSHLPQQAMLPSDRLLLEAEQLRQAAAAALARGRAVALAAAARHGAAQALLERAWPQVQAAEQRAKEDAQTALQAAKADAAASLEGWRAEAQLELARVKAAAATAVRRAEQDVARQVAAARATAELAGCGSWQRAAGSCNS
jgi:colicin import membrane protein